jgi:hypothetical protein
MEQTMNTQELIAALTLAKPCLGSPDSLLPVLTHFCFFDDIVYAYNEVSAIVIALDTKLNCGLHGDTLLGILSAAGAEEVKVKTGKDDVADINVGNGWVKVPAMKPETFVFEMPEEAPQCTVPLSDDFCSGLEACLVSV